MQCTRWAYDFVIFCRQINSFCEFTNKIKITYMYVCMHVYMYVYI